jgi:uncharacterized membrane protein YdbT with pleckstrin-like domain
MEDMEFRPREVVLVFWLIGLLLGSALIGGIVAGICSGARISPIIGFMLGTLVLFLLCSTYSVLYFFSIRYYLDDRYVSKASGVIWKRRRSIPLEKITNIDVRQGPFERFLGYGKIWIFTPSTGASIPEEKLIGVTSPHDMKQTIVQRSEAAKQSQVGGRSGPSSLSQSDDILPLLKDMRNSLKNIENALVRAQSQEGNQGNDT